MKIALILGTLISSTLTIVLVRCMALWNWDINDRIASAMVVSVFLWVVITFSLVYVITRRHTKLTTGRQNELDTG
jgi:hypothetical protein